MVASQSEIRLDIRPAPQWPEAAPDQAAAFSYDHRGVRYGWWPGLDLASVALDVELKDNRAGEIIRRRYAIGEDDFLARWTMTEVLAKLLDEPILSLIKRHGLVSASRDWIDASAAVPGDLRRVHGAVWLRAIELPDHWASVGYLDHRTQP